MADNQAAELFGAESSSEEDEEESSEESSGEQENQQQPVVRLQPEKAQGDVSFTCLAPGYGSRRSERGFVIIIQ